MFMFERYLSQLFSVEHFLLFTDITFLSGRVPNFSGCPSTHGNRSNEDPAYFEKFSFVEDSTTDGLLLRPTSVYLFF